MTMQTTFQPDTKRDIVYVKTFREYDVYWAGEIIGSFPRDQYNEALAFWTARHHEWLMQQAKVQSVEFSPSCDEPCIVCGECDQFPCATLEVENEEPDLIIEQPRAGHVKINLPGLFEITVVFNANDTAELAAHERDPEDWCSQDYYAIRIGGKYDFNLILVKHTIGRPERLEAMQQALVQALVMVQNAIAELSTPEPTPPAAIIEHQPSTTVCVVCEQVKPYEGSLMCDDCAARSEHENSLLNEDTPDPWHETIAKPICKACFSTHHRIQNCPVIGYRLHRKHYHYSEADVQRCTCDFVSPIGKNIHRCSVFGCYIAHYDGKPIMVRCHTWYQAKQLLDRYVEAYHNRLMRVTEHRRLAA